MAFATIDDLASRWRALQPNEQHRAASLLDDAAVLITAEFKRAGKSIDNDDEFLMSALKIVSCSMVKRVLASSGSSVSGVDGDFTQISKTAGSFNEQFTFANPSGDMYMTDREYKMIGLSKNISKIGFLEPAIHHHRHSKGHKHEGRTSQD